MASKAIGGLPGRVLFCKHIFFCRNFRLERQIPVGACILLTSSKLQYCTLPNNTKAIQVDYKDGLPVFSVPLPSRHENCLFTLKPLSNTLNDLCTYIQQEDKGVDRVAAYSIDGVRVAKSTPIEILLRSRFQLVINEDKFTVEVPDSERLQGEHLESLSDVKTLIAQLHSALSVDQHQLEQERALRSKLEDLRTQLQPYEQVKTRLEAKASTRTNMMAWLGLGMMGLQFGILARLTWWEYSWDIMEPVTYFVTYGTTIAMYAYYVLTRQEYSFPDVRDRAFLLAVHRYAKQNNLDVNHYNQLKEKMAQIEFDLQRLRDPLQLHLPIMPPIPEKKKELEGRL